jgi:protein-tyrosine phosphatase
MKEAKGPAPSEGLLDLHCHILPGVDDGAVDLVEALEMAGDARAQGCSALVATSHLWENLFDTSPELLREEHAHLTGELRSRGIPLEVFFGAENFFGEMEPEEFAEKALPLGPGGRWVLFDFPMRSLPAKMIEVIGALRTRGHRALIAHPERNIELQRDPGPFAEWIAEGALLQVNAGSLLGHMGSAARKSAEFLLERGAAHVLASDAHDRRRRPFCLKDACAAASQIVGEEEALRMVQERPWKIARGEEVEVARVEFASVSPAQRIWRRFLDLKR